MTFWQPWKQNLFLQKTKHIFAPPRLLDLPTALWNTMPTEAVFKESKTTSVTTCWWCKNRFLPYILWLIIGWVRYLVELKQPKVPNLVKSCFIYFESNGYQINISALINNFLEACFSTFMRKHMRPLKCPNTFLNNLIDSPLNSA